MIVKLKSVVNSGATIYDEKDNRFFFAITSQNTPEHEKLTRLPEGITFSIKNRKKRFLVKGKLHCEPDCFDMQLMFYWYFSPNKNHKQKFLNNCDITCIIKID